MHISYFLPVCVALVWRTTLCALSESQCIDGIACQYWGEYGSVQRLCFNSTRNDQFDEQDCSEDSVESCKEDKLRDTQNTVMLPAVSSSVGLVILISIIGILLYCKKRRQRQHHVTKTDILNPSRVVEFNARISVDINKRQL